MKKITTFYSVLLTSLLIINSEIYTQWELRYPDIPSDQINDIIFLNELIGFFVNSGGSVLMTTDGGINWEIKDHFQRDTFSEIKFIDNQNGFAISPHSHIGDDVSFIFTTDGGLNWDDGNVYMGDALTFLPLSLSIILKSSEYDGTINKLDNFFGNWIETYRIPYFYDDDYSVPYGDILQFQRLSTGGILALCSSWRAKNANVISDSISFILKSDDLGSSWDTLWCDLPYASQTFTFINDSIGWLGAEQNRIYKTTDGGSTWTLQYSGSLQDFEIKSISTPDGINVFGVDGSGKVIYSTDNGLNWQSIQVGQAYDYPFKIKFLSSTKGFLAGYDSTSYDFWITNNGGISWERVSKSLKGNLRKIDFANENTGIGVGENFIYKTLDGGRKWEVIYESPLEFFSGLDMLDSLNVWVVGYDSLYKSTNGGNSWLPITVDNGIELMRGIHFLDSNIGVLFEVWKNDSTFNYVTTDGGDNWKKHSINDNQFVTSFDKMKFTDPRHLWFANQYGVWLSRDTAKTWELFEVEDAFLAFDFIDSLYGWISLWGGQSNEMSYTTNGGVTWITIDRPYSFQAEDVFIFREGNYFGGLNTLVTGYEGSLLKYKQGDNFVYKIPTYTGNPLFSFASYRKNNNLHVWVTGNGMSVLHAEYYITDINDPLNKENLTFDLFQNYPNPFNPNTKIEFRIANFGFVSFKVYDVLGREVATLVNEEKSPGVYEVEFDASQLSSGIYFYKLQTDNYSSTKKMIYLK